MSDEYTMLGRIYSSLEEIRKTLPHLRVTSDLQGLFWIAVLIFILSGWSGSKLDRWTDRVWYSFRYDAGWKQVNVTKRPLDCDFFHAPIGDKGCHYKKDTLIFSDEQRRGLLQQATSDEERQEIARRPNSVILYWNKKEE